MPTRLRDSPLVRPTSGGRLREFRSRFVQEEAQGPFLGFTPDPSPQGLDMRSASDADGLVNYGAALIPEMGWERIDIPTGANSWPIGDEGAAGTPGTFEAPATEPQPITAIGQAFRGSSALGSSDDNAIRFFVTSEIATPSHADVSGHFATINTSGALVEIPYNATDFPAAAGRIAGKRDNLFDWATAPWLGLTNRYGGVVYTNDFDEVYLWDFDTAAGGGGLPGDIILYRGAVTQAAGKHSASAASFKARSVAHWADRMFFFNVEDGGSRHARRLQWTIVGDMDLSGVGSGSRDLHELEAEGLRVETLGNFLAAYSRRGVAFLSRPTLPTDGVRVEYLSTERGLMSTHSLLRLSPDTHFGIFNDGWYLLSSTGQWAELGMLNAGGLRVPKWKRYFYEHLDYDDLSRVTLGHDKLYGRVRITWPTQSGTLATWVYDLNTDSVWPQDYGVVTWGEQDGGQSAVATIGAGPSHGAGFGTIGSAYPAGTTIGSFAPRQLRGGVVHGGADGVAYVHQAGLFTRDGVMPQYRFATHLLPSGNPGDKFRHKRVTVERELGSNTDPITVGLRDAQGRETTGTIASLPQTGNSGVQTGFADYNVTSTHHRLELSGQHPQIIHGFALDAERVGHRDKRQD